MSFRFRFRGFRLGSKISGGADWLPHYVGLTCSTDDSHPSKQHCPPGLVDHTVDTDRVPSRDDNPKKISAMLQFENQVLSRSTRVPTRDSNNPVPWTE